MEIPADTPVPPSDPSSTFTLSTTNTTLDAINVARKKHEDRAKRFGVEFVEPKQAVVHVHGPKRYINPKQSGFVTGFSLNDEAEQRKREVRAKKFAVVDDAAASSSEIPPPSSDADDQADAMDSGMDVDLREERRDVGVDVQRRLDTIYLYGTDEMSTDDVFKYFKDYGAASVEWINDSSCNIIFNDVHTAMRALQGMSKPMDAFNLQITQEKGLVTTTPTPPPTTTPPTTAATDPSAQTPADAQPAPIAPVSVQATPEQINLYGWRKGLSVKGVPMLMRYATVEDVKSKEFKPSAYYKKMLAQLRAKAQQKHKQHNNNNSNNNNKNKKKKNKKNRNRNKSGGDGDDTRVSKRKFDDGDVDMVDPAEQEKRSQSRRRRFFPESNTTTTDADTASTYIVSSSTVPALLQEVPAPQV